MLYKESTLYDWTISTFDYCSGDGIKAIGGSTDYFQFSKRLFLKLHI